MISIEIFSIEIGAGNTSDGCDNITKYFSYPTYIFSLWHQPSLYQPGGDRPGLPSSDNLPVIEKQRLVKVEAKEND